MSNLYIREATLLDIQSLYDLECQCDHDVYSLNLIRDSIEDNYTRNLLLIKDESVIGYVSATIIFDECNLLKIVVDKTYRGNGYAKYLLQELVNICKFNNSNKIFLEVRNDNFSAIKLYEKFGFEKTNVRKNYYSNGVDALIYWYYIND